MLPVLSFLRLLSIKRQNSSISAIRSRETRIVSESDESFSAFRARRRADSFTKKDFLLSLVCLDIMTSKSIDGHAYSFVDLCISVNSK